MSCDGKVEHYRIIYHASKLSIDEEVYFENLMQLVEVSGARRPWFRLQSHHSSWMTLGTSCSLCEPTFPHASIEPVLCASVEL